MPPGHCTIILCDIPGPVRITAYVRQHRLGGPHVHHGHRPGLLQRVARGQVPDEPRGEELQRLLLHVRPYDVHCLHCRYTDSVQVQPQLKLNSI